MHEDLSATYRRWREADAQNADDDADAAFKAVFQACTAAPLPSSRFTAATMAEIAARTAADARRAKSLRRALVWSGVPAGAAAVYFFSGTLLSLLSNAFVSSLNVLVSIVVWSASGPDVRSGLWSVLTAIGRAAAAFVADPRVTVAMLVFQIVAVAALTALHRLLGPEREWLK